MMLAARGVEADAWALAGALDELEHRAAVRGLVDGFAEAGKQAAKR